jgi:hypothetical protein
MSDDLSKKGMQDRTRINTSEDYELRYWSEKLGVSPDRLKAAVQNRQLSLSDGEGAQGRVVRSGTRQALGGDAGCTHGS